MDTPRDWSGALSTLSPSHGKSVRSSQCDGERADDDPPQRADPPRMIMITTRIETLKLNVSAKIAVW